MAAYIPLQTNSDTPPSTRAVKNVAVIINPVACPSGIEARKAEIVPALAQSGWNVQTFETCAPEGAFPEARSAVEAGVDLVIVVGGDGTLMEAMNALIGTPIPVAIIPSGTGNLLALNLGIPTDTPSALAIALNGAPKPIDLVRVNDGQKYFAIMGGVGYDARIMEETDRRSKQKFGRLAYMWTALKNLGGRRFTTTLTLDGDRRIRQIAKSVLFANMGEIMPGVKAFPDARPDDGLIEIGVLKAESVGDFLRLFLRLLIGRPQDDPAFDLYHAKRLQLKLGRAEPLELDGDSLGATRQLDLEVAPGAISVMIP
ncbi:MAG TPA: YegS/Rv2252/BmrU family lipid kinase [Capsulimonadaceae bacterium]|nr:YegS/Rv2252/BmrU family lipid kinase [Capsulimonadaceae bacterium]